MDLAQENEELRKQIAERDKQIVILMDKLNKFQAPEKEAQVNSSKRPVVDCPKVLGTHRPEHLTTDTLVCFYNKSGKDCGLLVHDGLVRTGMNSSWLSYQDLLEDPTNVEKSVASAQKLVLVLSHGSLLVQSAVFIVKCSVAYNIPVVLVHDLASCYFPNPTNQPIQIQEAGIFNDKAITFVKDYFETVFQQILKMIESVSHKHNFCVCYSADTPVSDLDDTMQQLQNVKHSTLLTCSNEVAESDYVYHIKHTINKCNSLIFVLDKNSALCTNFLVTCAKLAQTAKLRLYFLELEPVSDAISELLQSNDIAIHSLSGITMDIDGPTCTPMPSQVFEVKSSIRSGDILFIIPLYTGKHYYEIELVTNGDYNQLGWANPLIDLTVEGNGIGDDPHSYGYDGSRELLFPRKPYGKKWGRGDIIGCMLNLDDQEISFSQNGENLGIAFSNFREKDDDGNYLPYMPGASLYDYEVASVNFGGAPFKYLPQGFEPVHSSIPLVFADNVDEIFAIEINYGNYKVNKPRTRAFLSHKRSSAQGVAGRIWQELKNDYNIFLDSEAQFDLHDLKLISKHTGLFVFILSEGIFDSYWCLEGIIFYYIRRFTEIELRSAIRHNRRVLVLQDFQFKIPTEFPDHLQDIKAFLETADKILYMAEFFSECIKQIRVRLGATDSEAKEILKYVGDQTKESILKDNFGEGNSTFDIIQLPTSLSNYLALIDSYFECSSMCYVDTLMQQNPSQFYISDEDMEVFVKRCPKLRTMAIYGSVQFTDKAMEYLGNNCPEMQMITVWWNCPNLTNAGMHSMAKLKNLRRFLFSNPVGITDDGIIALKDLQHLDAFAFFGESNFTDIGFENIPNNVIYLNLPGSTKITPKGIKKFMQKKPARLVSADLGAQVNDEAVIEIFKNCKMLEELTLKGANNLTAACLNTVPLPANFKKLVLPQSVNLQVPPGSSVVIHYE